ncbi:uncharacterized protein LOC125494168 [Beta vulgaris subsp. vulgaris]|uniref:uncharacterized protein LOC125494168 n=1 Tax=Beta vulgaris subsp. vulgaris TaxID=3555 RepID=UPI002036C812|nr:uncharacterized protein LOC125494168 [Beta vulgaris subsp. vulgaris]
MSVKQQEHESLADYIKRFSEESLKISNLQDGVAFTALMLGLWPKNFRCSLVENEVTKVMSRTRKFIQASDIYKPVPKKLKKRNEEVPYRESNKSTKSNQQLLPRATDHGNDPHLNKNQREIYLDIKHNHTTKDCRDLKKALDHLADQGKLNSYIKHSREEKGKEKEAKNDSDNTDGYVAVIARGHASGGLSGRARKAHLQSMKHHVLEVEPTKVGCHVMTFGEPDRHIHTPHDDTLVIEIKISNSRAKWILVDSGSSADIITLDSLRKLKYNEKDVKSTSQLLIGFREESVFPVGFVKLAVRLREREERIEAYQSNS